MMKGVPAAGPQAARLLEPSMLCVWGGEHLPPGDFNRHIVFPLWMDLIPSADSRLQQRPRFPRRKEFCL